MANRPGQRESIGDIAYWSFGVQKIQVEYHTLWLCQNNYGKSPFIVIFPLKNGDFPVRYVSLPEGNIDFLKMMSYSLID